MSDPYVGVGRLAAGVLCTPAVVPWDDPEVALLRSELMEG